MNGSLPRGLHALAPERSSSSVDISRLQDFLRRRWRLASVTTVASGAIAAAIVLSIVPRYTATASVLLEHRPSRVFGKDSILPDTVVDAASIESQIPVAQSFNLLRGVAEREGLAHDPEFAPSEGWGWSILPRGLPAPKTIPGSTDGVVGEFRDRLDVQRVARANVLTVSVASRDAAKAARLANAVAAAIVADQNEARYAAAKAASSWLVERMDALRSRLFASETALASFRVSHRLDSASVEGRVTLSEQQLAELNGRLAAARAELAEKRARYDLVREIEVSGAPADAVPDVVRSTVVGKLREQQAELARKEADLASRYGAAYPTVANARAERRDLDRSIRAEIDRILANVRNEHEIARSREASLRASLMGVSGEAGLDGEAGIALRDLVRTNDANKALYEQFLAKARSTQEQSGLEERDARVISEATAPVHPSSPRAKLIMVFALLFGSTSGIGLGLALDLLRAGFETPRDVEAALRFPVLATIPTLPARKRRLKGRVLNPAEYVVHHPLSQYGEAIRALRAGVAMSERDAPPKITLITSVAPAEGKSTLVASLGFSAAATGRRVLLVDCDLRRSRLSRMFGLEGSSGLVDVLTGARPLDEVLSARGGVTLLPAGSKTEHPADLLSGDRMPAILDALRSRFDQVVVDAAPIGPVIDARILASLVDAVVLVVRWRETPREIVMQHVDALHQAGKVAGVALNLVDGDKAPRYGSHAYGERTAQTYYEA